MVGRGNHNDARQVEDAEAAPQESSPSNIASDSCVDDLESRATDVTWFGDAASSEVPMIDPTFCSHNNSPTTIRDMFRYELTRQCVTVGSHAWPPPRVLSESCINPPRGSPAAPAGLYMDDRLRCQVVAWMVEHAAQFGLCQATLFLAVTLLDRFAAAATEVHYLGQAFVFENLMCPSTAHSLQFHSARERHVHVCCRQDGRGAWLTYPVL